jgi:hypothetical protein
MSIVEAKPTAGDKPRVERASLERTMKTWQKVVYLSGTNSFLMAGDPDFSRLTQHQDHVLHPLLGDGWVIKQITPVMGGTAFVLMEKTAAVE